MRSTAAIFGAPVTEPPGKSAPRISARPASGRSVALDGRDEMLDAGQRLGDHQLRPADRAGDADAREVVALEVDDHDVLGGVLGRGEELCAAAEGPGPLDGPRPEHVPAPREEELGRGRDDRPVVSLEDPPRAVAERRVVRLCQGGEPGGERARAARERRREVLHEIDLVDVAARDRRAHCLDGGGVVALGPGPLPASDDEAPILVVILDIMDLRPDGARRKRQRARLRRNGRDRPADRLGEPVAEVEVRDERLPAGREEPSLHEPALDPLERPLGLVDLEQLGRASAGTVSRHLDRRRVGIAATFPGRRRNDCRRLHGPGAYEEPERTSISRSTSDTRAAPESARLSSSSARRQRSTWRTPSSPARPSP